MKTRFFIESVNLIRKKSSRWRRAFWHPVSSEFDSESESNSVKLKRRRKLYFGLVVILLVAGASFFFYSQKTQAAWWNEAWMYRKSIEISNVSGSDLTNQRVKITIDTAALLSAGKIKDNCDDIRVTDIGGKILDHWDTNCNTATTTVYVKMLDLPVSGATIFLYYGNPSVVSIEKKLGTQDNPGTSCKMMKDQGSVTVDGAYYIVPGGSDADKVQVFCDMTTLSEGWTVVLNSNRGIAVNPEPNWNDAVNSINITGVFGSDLTAFDLIMGLKHWDYIGSTAMVQIGTSPTSITKRATYAAASLDVGNNYALNLGTETLYLGAGSPGIKSSGTKQFTTYDADHDTHASNCASFYGNSPWWYGACWSGSFWGGGDSGGYQNAPFWTGSSTDYNDYGSILLGGIDTMKNVATGAIGVEEKSPGPIAYWKMDEGSGSTVNDSTGHNKNGSFFSAPIWKTEDQCVSGKCLIFDNVDDGVNVANENFTSLTDYTMCSWVNPKGNHKNYTGTIMSSGDWNNTHWAFGINQTNTQIQTRKADGVNFPVWNYTFSLNQWAYVCITRSAATIKAYVNGAMVGSQYNGTTGNIISNAMNTAIGRETYAGGYFAFNGLLDEPKIYAYARSADQIKQDYNSGSAGMSTSKGAAVSIGSKSDKWMSDGLVGYWKIDASDWTASTGEIKDSSGMNNNGNSYGSVLTQDRLNRDDESLKLSVNDETQLLDYRTWKDDQTGSVSVFGQNGSTTENFRVLDVDPWGRKVPVWEARPDNVSGPDGGWASVNITVDQTKMYRFSVWIRRSILGNGTYYMGTYGKNSAGTNFGVLNRSNGAVNTNPYFRATGGNEISSADSWFLLVGHVWPANSGTGSVYTDTGLYNSAGTKIATPIDFAWQDGTVYAVHRSYLYYSTDTSTRQQWVYPRVDVVDGTEPTIADLLAGHDKYGNDLEATVSGDKESFAFWYDQDSDGSWEHIVNSSGTFYVDGKPATPTNYPVYVSGDDIFFGRTSSTDFINGSIDDVRVYNKTLSPQEVSQLYNWNPVTVDKSPIGYWKFDEGSGTVANNSGSGGTSLNGSATNTTWTNDGKIGKALNFNNTASVTVPVFNYDSITVAGWFKRNSIDATSADAIWGGWAWNADAQLRKGYDLRFYINSAVLNWTIETTNGTTITEKTIASGNLNVGQWYYAVGTYDSSTGMGRLYIDGNKVAESAVPAGSTLVPQTNYSDMKIGNSRVNNGYFNGIIDEVKIYNYALTTDEVASDYNQSKSVTMSSQANGNISMGASSEYCVPGDTATCTAPVGEWKFDEKQGTTAKDTSGNNNTGILISSPAWTQGKTGAAVNFNGSGKKITLATPIGQAGYMTASIWYRRDENSSSTSWRTLLGSATANMHHLIINNSSRNIGIWDGGWKDFSYNPPNDGKWHHYEVIYNSGVNATLYVDGVYKNQIATTLSLSSNPIGIIGNGGASYDGYWAGPIDNVEIYNYARTPAQVAYDYNRGGPVGWWKMDECQGGTVNDSSGNGNAGTITIGAAGSQTSAGTCTASGTAWGNGATGKFNASLNFDGVDDYVDLGNDNSIKNISSQISVSAWVKYNAYGGGGQSYSVVAVKGNPGTFLMENPSNKIRFRVTVGGVDKNASDSVVHDLNRWYHFVGTYDGSNIKIYKDGVLAGSTPATGSLSINDVTVKIGTYQGANYNLNGQIDDVRIYNYALTPTQVTTVMNEGAALRFGN